MMCQRKANTQGHDLSKIGEKDTAANVTKPRSARRLHSTGRDKLHTNNLYPHLHAYFYVYMMLGAEYGEDRRAALF